MLALHWKRDAMRNELIRRLPHVDLIALLMMGDDDASLRAMEHGPIVLQRPMPNDATLLHFATTPAAAARLLELGVRLDATDKYGKTPLQRAAERGHADLARFLIAEGAAVDEAILAQLGVVPAGGGTPRAAAVVAAVQAGQAGVVRLLLDRGADVHARDDKGSRATLLHIAAWRGDLEMARLLLDHGSDPTATDMEHGTTPAVWARTAGQYTGNERCDAVAGLIDGWPASDAMA